MTVTRKAEVQDSGVTNSSSVTIQKTKMVTDLTKEEEESMVEWLEAYPILYNKKLQAYKDSARKEKLWMGKPSEIGNSVLVLETWYTSLRSRIGRLSKKRSGDEATEVGWQRETYGLLGGSNSCAPISMRSRRRPLSV